MPWNIKTKSDMFFRIDAGRCVIGHLIRFQECQLQTSDRAEEQSIEQPSFAGTAVRQSYRKLLFVQDNQPTEMSVKHEPIYRTDDESAVDGYSTYDMSHVSAKVAHIFVQKQQATHKITENRSTAHSQFCPSTLDSSNFDKYSQLHGNLVAHIILKLLDDAGNSRSGKSDT
ncbi:hypothetical protein CSKR_111706 [Clonorchis sinensis]|uniref:Uncharacterized protein n=1 Tax=Clonorchis sinensis TaxID=79923 RepID=A0A3R7D528_CLOSI|nr:hypothetical protein CSKR_111706 [Clonorchis sinensis]